MPPENQDQKKNQEGVGEQWINTPSPFGKPEKKEYVTNPDLKTLRTFQGDVEETIKNKNESATSIVIAEQESKKEPVPELPEKKSGNIFISRGFLFIAGILLFISGAIILTMVYYKKSPDDTAIEVALNNNLIQYTDKKSIDLDITKTPVGTSAREIIIKNLVGEADKYDKPTGSVLYLQFFYNKTELSSQNFFQNVAVSAPPVLARTFGQKYMAGIYSSDTNGIFFIFSPEDYGNAYTGMLKWESSVINDLSPFFGADKSSSVSFSVASGTPIFKDDTFNNQDVRILRDLSGDIVLTYGFINKNTLIITDNEKIYQAIVNKYRNSKLVR